LFIAAHLWRRNCHGVAMSTYLGRSPIAALLVVLLQCGPAFAGNPVFLGSLERLRHRSISIRLADGRLLDAVLPRAVDLPASAIAARFNIGDQVQIACKPIRTVYDPVAELHQHMELEDLRFLRPASTEELAVVVATLSWQHGENLLKQLEPISAGGRTGAPGELERVRQVNLEYVSKLPNFVADEVAKRYSSDLTAKQWRLEDTIESEISVKNARLTRQHIRRNGKPWDYTFNDLDGMHWEAFGRELKPVFDKTCSTRIDFSGSEETAGQQLLVYRFSPPPGGCFPAYPLRETPNPRVGRYNPARTGRILVDATRGNVIRYEEEAGGFWRGVFSRSTFGSGVVGLRENRGGLVPGPRFGRVCLSPGRWQHPPDDRGIPESPSL
jgi:hypothetical protein